MRAWPIALLVGGCSFEHGAFVGTHDGAPSGDAPLNADARIIDASAVTMDAIPPPTCRVSDSSLVLCLEFDEAGLASATHAIDGSGHAHDPAISNIALATRNQPAASQAITLSTSSALTLTKPTDFNLQDFTMTAWIYRTSDVELGVFDTEKQYTLSVSSADHTVECALGNTSLQTVAYLGGSPTGINEWDLIACTYDGSQVCTYSFRNGSVQAQKVCFARNTTTSTMGASTSIGEWTNGTSHFVGSIDQVRVYNRALTQKQICTAGGITGC